MSDSDPITFCPPSVAGSEGKRGRPKPPSAVPHLTNAASREPAMVVFNRLELNDIFNVYGRRVAAGDWRDYAIDWGRETASFSIFRRASEVPIYRVVKAPKLARRQGAFAVISASGQILKRGHELKQVLAVLDQRLSLVK